MKKKDIFLVLLGLLIVIVTVTGLLFLVLTASPITVQAQERMNVAWSGKVLTIDLPPAEGFTCLYMTGGGLKDQHLGGSCNVKTYTIVWRGDDQFTRPRIGGTIQRKRIVTGDGRIIYPELIDEVTVPPFTTSMPTIAN